MFINQLVLSYVTNVYRIKVEMRNDDVNWICTLSTSLQNLDLQKGTLTQIGFVKISPKNILSLQIKFFDEVGHNLKIFL